MSEQGICSRREADAFIEKGLVYVDGERVQPLLANNTITTNRVSRR
jgi:16S rRNA U516 pseudouridylate synthase RsuA-like enzyme